MHDYDEMKAIDYSDSRSRGFAWAEDRYYGTPPEHKTLEQCAQHGRDHSAYSHSRQTDPGWSDEQLKAYHEGYDKEIPNRGR